MRKTFQDITHPDDLEADLALVHQMLTKEIRTYRREKRYIHKSGRIVWISLSVSLIWKDEDNPLYFISQIEDITDRKQAQENLKKSEERLSKFFMVAPVGIAVTSLPDGRLLDINNEFETMLGMDRSEAVGKTTMELGIGWTQRPGESSDTCAHRGKGQGCRSSGQGQTREYRHPTI